MEQESENKHFCRSSVEFTKPPGAPDGEVARVCATGDQHGTGVMMEWERPISAPFISPCRLILDTSYVTRIAIQFTKLLACSWMECLDLGFAFLMLDLGSGWFVCLIFNWDLFNWLMCITALD